jgi:Double-GTPase 2
MDELIGGLLALAVAAVIATVLIAAAIAVFALGAAGGALVGLGQGGLAFASDLGGSVGSRGRGRRQPLPPEPAFQLYVLGQFKDDLEAALKRAWAEMLSFRAACVRFADQYNSGATTPLAWGVIAGGYAAPLIGAALGLLVAAPILLVAGILIAGAWLLVLVLRLAEAARRRLRRTAYECPRDHERFPLPVYVCPNCSAEHHRLVPGRWGIFRRECSCQAVALPTTVIGGRQRVPQRCPSGHPMSGLIGFAETLRIALVAGPSAGKTTYLAGAMLAFEEMAAEKRLAAEVLDESSAAYSEVVGGLRQGRLPQKTQISGNPALVTEIQGNDRSRVLYAYDVAGENYQAADQTRNLRFLEVPSGLILLVDPLSIPRVAEEHAAELSEAREAVRPSPEEPIRVLERVLAALIEGGADPREVPIAVVIGKTDAFGIGAEIEELRGSAGDGAPRAWLEANGAGNFVRAVESEFKDVSWFACSALGRIPDGDDKSAFEPRGATEPLLWLLARRGVVPARRPFEPSRTAQRLAGADATTFAPIGNRGWAWRVAAGSFAVLAVLAVAALGVVRVAQSVSPGGAAASGAPSVGGSGGAAEAAGGFAGGSAEGSAQPAVDSRGFPTVSRGRMTHEIRQPLYAFHRAVVDGEFNRAWRLLTARKRRQALREGGYSKWRRNQATLTPYLDPNGLRVHIAALEGGGVARVDVTGMHWYDPHASCSEWSGLTWVKYERGAWYYDPGYSTTRKREREWRPHYDELMGTTC